MGFYGALAKSTKSSFSFDRVYPNRATMDATLANGQDDVFIGRYVLVDYDRSPSNVDAQDTNVNTPSTRTIPGYIVQVEGKYTFHTGASYSSPRFKLGTKASADTVKAGDLLLITRKVIVTSLKTVTKPLGGTDPQETTVEQVIPEETSEEIVPQIWKCIGSDGEYASFEFVSYKSDVADLETDYLKNYTLDNNRYGNIGRGWDSTVWQKVSRLNDSGQSEAVYVMVAELNSVVPTFDISVDAPTETPVKPHFGADNTNVYYKLHVQPSWGMRLKGSDVSYSTDNSVYPSDIDGRFVIDSTIEKSGVNKQTRQYKTIKLDENGERVKDENGNYIYEWKTANVANPKAIDDTYTKPLAVYFNKAGFDPYKGSDALKDVEKKNATITTVAEQKTDLKGDKYYALRDNIAMRPTGYSLEKYNQHEGLEYRPKENSPDTYELSIMLPSIGQTVSDMWDKIYGESTIKDNRNRTLFHPITGEFATDSANGGIRNTDIRWNSKNGARAINSSGQFDSSKLGTLSGVLNTAQDIMGMIIRHKDNLNDVTNWDPTKIYEVGGKYYRKAKTYTYSTGNETYKRVTPITVKGSGLYRRVEEQLPYSTDSQVSNKVYYNYINASNEDYIDGATYGTITAGAKKTLSAINYKASTYYYKKGKDYKLDESGVPTDRSGQYYEITPARMEQNTEFYIPNRYYVVKPDGTIYLANQDTLAAVYGNEDKTKFEFYRTATSTKSNEVDGTSFSRKDVGPLNVLMEFPEDTNNWAISDGTLIIKNNNGETIDTSTDFDKDLKTYYTYRYLVEDTTNDYLSKWEVYKEGRGRKLTNITQRRYEYTAVKNDNLFKVSNSDKVKLIDFEADKYYYKDSTGKDFILETSNGLKRTTQGLRRNRLENGYTKYYTLNVKALAVFYDLSQNLYTLESTGNWERETVLKTNIADARQYYEAPTFTKREAVFYRPNYLYTLVDGHYILATGEYNVNTTYYEKVGKYVISDSNGYHQGEEWFGSSVPNGVKVGQRNETWKAALIPEFDTNLNTMHGSLLKIHKLLANDELTRDRSTVQGAINSVNDLLNRFSTLTPTTLMSVDNYGRLKSATIVDDNWTGLSVDGNPTKPTLTIRHKDANTVSDTTSNTNKNGNGDTIDLYTPILDSKGHVVGKNTNTVTLPYDFKTLTVGAESSAATNLAHAAGSIVADNTQDTATFTPSNKWVKLAANANSDTINIGHLVGSITTTAKTATNLGTNTSASISLDDITHDEAGHITARQSHTYNLPHSFGIVSADGNNAVSANTYDTLAITTSDNWLSTSVNGKTIDFTHKADLTAITVGDNANQTPNFGSTFKTLRVGRDTAGHVTTLSEHNVTIPKPSLTDTKANGNVVTGLSLTDTTGAFSTSRANIGTLALTGYSSVSSISAMPTATDSLNTAVSKLAYVLNNDTTQVGTRISNAINALDVASVGGSGKYIQSISETNGKISAVAVDMPDYVTSNSLTSTLNNYAKASSVTALQDSFKLGDGIKSFTFGGTSSSGNNDNISFSFITSDNKTVTVTISQNGQISFTKNS